MKKVLEIDYTDWYDDVMRSEETIQCKDDVFELITRGKQTSDIAKAAIVSREEGITVEEVIKPNKMLLLSGTMMNVAGIVKGRKHEINTDSGKTYYVPEYIGKTGRRNGNKKAQQTQQVQVQDDDDDDQYPDNYQKSVSEDGLRLAERYLTRIIPGHIFNHLLVVYENEGDIQKVTEQLKDSIDAMVARLE